jgi:lipopolysaccharide exporter
MVLSGSVLGQAVAFGLLPFIARLYGTETIGQVGATLGVLGILSLLASWQYDQAVIVAQDEHLNYLLLFALLLISGLSVFLGLTLYFTSIISQDILIFLDRIGINYYLLILIFPYALFLLLTNLRLRNNHLLHVSVARLFYYGGTAVLQTLTAIVWSATSQAFLLSQALAACLAIIILFPYRSVPAWRQKLQSSRITEITQKMFIIARIYVDFPRYQAGAQVLNAFSLNLPVLVLNAGFSAAWAGWYFMANRLLAAPTVLLSQAIGQVFYRDSAERERSGIAQAQTLERTATALIKLSLFAGVTLGTTAPFWVRVVLGEAWLPVASILQILLVVFIVTFFTSPFSTLLNVKGRQKGALGYYALLTLTRTVAVFIAWRLRSEWLLVWLYVIASLLVMAPLFRYIVHSAGASLRRIAVNVFPMLVEVAVVLAVAAILSFFGLRDRWAGFLLLAVILSVVGLVQLRSFQGWRSLNKAKA